MEIIKKSEIKDKLTEIKNNLQRIHSRVDEAENKLVNWNIRKQKQPNRTAKKKI